MLTRQVNGGFRLNHVVETGPMGCFPFSNTSRHKHHSVFVQ